MRSLAIPFALSPDTVPAGKSVKPAPGSVKRPVAAFSNPKFDPRIRNVLNADGTPLRLSRGKLAAYHTPNEVNFLYNPSTISVNHSLDVSILPDQFKSPDALGYEVGATTGEVRWALLFDRTYETWDRAKYKNTLQGDTGVYADVRALYQLLKIVGSDNPETYEKLPTGEFPTGFMQMIPVLAYFGDMAAFSLTYYGYITGLSVDYTHWTQRMIPNRCVVNLSMSIYPLTSAATTAMVDDSTQTPPNAPKASGGATGAGSDGVDSNRPDRLTRGRNAK